MSSDERSEGGADPRHNFIRDIIEDDLASGKHDTIVTRFPPEPNGYLHIGHATSIVLNHSIAVDYDGEFHLRFDDTNPITEEEEYVESIKRDVAWLGADWGEHLYFASDYFERMYELAERLIKKDKAYVDSLSPEEIREYRGNWNEPGEESPYRDRDPEESLELFRRMRAGEFEEGEHVLRAKIDMQSDNMVMRDPIMYRILHEEHHHVDEAWCIYPMYDYAHCLEDSFEGITHSLCSMEFENNREVYNWFIRETEVDHQPRQIEFARRNLGYTITSKRRLKRLVDEGYVEGWDDPRMPTISGLRRRGFTPESIRTFCHAIGIARSENRVEYNRLESAIRDDLNEKAPRRMCVEDPVRVVVTNYPDDEVEWFDVPSYPHDVPGEGSRMVPFSGELYVDRDDVREDPPDGFYRLYPGNEVRLRWAWVVECQEVVRDADGDIEEVRVTYDPETRGGETPDGREIPGTIHWVDSQRALPCELRLYDRLFEVEDPRGAEGDYTDYINDDSLVIKQGYIEPSVRLDAPGTRYQFERNGYFMSETRESSPDQLVYNRIVTLRDTWESRRAEERKREAERRAEQRRREKERKRQEARAARQKRIDALTEVARGADVEGYEPTPRDQTRMEDGTLRDRLDGYLQELELTPDEGDLLSGSPALSDYFEQMRQEIAADAAAKWLVNTLVPLIGAEVGTDAFEKAFEDEAPPVEHATALVQILEADRVTHNVGEEVLDEMLETGDGPEAIIEREGLEAITDTAQLGSIIGEVMADNPDQVDAYGQGKRKLLGYFIGQVMQATQGKAEPQTVRELLQQELPDPSQGTDD